MDRMRKLEFSIIAVTSYYGCALFKKYCSCLSKKPGPEVIKLFPCSTQISMIFLLLINVKMPSIVGILTFMSRENSLLGLSEPEKKFLDIFILVSILYFMLS